MAEIKAAPRLTLAQKIRKAREFTTEVNGFKFTLRRPTELEYMDKIAGTGSTGRFLPFVVDWDNVREMDVMPHGEPHPLAFDEKVRDEWLSDRTDIFSELVIALLEEFNRHAAEREDISKN